VNDDHDNSQTDKEMLAKAQVSEPGDHMHRWLVICRDAETGDWTVITNTKHKLTAHQDLGEIHELHEEAFAIYTGDFVTI